MFFTLLPGNYVLLDEDSLKTCIEPILRTLFAARDREEDTEEPTEFVQLHLSTEEVSIIVPERHLCHFNSSRHTAPYRAIRVDTENPGLDEPGILAEVTALFKQASISILSVSTYHYNYIFVQTSDMESFTELVNDNKEIIHFETT